MEYQDYNIGAEDAEERARLEQEALAQKLANLSQAIKSLRDDAIKARASSGIEAEWLQDEEYYQGIDDANRAEAMSKPTSPDGRVMMANSSGSKATRSTVFVKLTRPYVDAAAARVADMLLPTDDRNWDIRPTPIPSLVEQSEGKEGVEGVEQAQAIIAAAKKASDRARTRIDDWLTQSGYNAELRLVIDDAARMGVGILKGPFPENVRRRAVIQAMEGIGISIKEEILPRSRRIDPWNFYPDGSCGEKMQNGKYVFERDDINGRQLKDLAQVPGYIEAAINAVISEGPKSPVSKESKRHQNDSANDKESYEIWYYHGYLSGEDLNTAFDCGCAVDGERFNDEAQYPAIVTMVNDTVIKAALSPLDSGEFPYDVMIWQRRQGSWAGAGVARQMRTSQDGVNAATRNMMDNAGLSSGPILIIDQSKIKPADGDWTLRPRKVFLTTDSFDGGSVRDAITWVNITALQQELMAIIQFWMQRAEDETGLPMLMQGQLGKAPDTVGGMQLLNNNASGVLRRIARTFDDRITEPHIGRYYEWLLLHGKDAAEKGDFVIDARGSAALVERDAQAQSLMQMVALAGNPAFGLDPEKVMAEILKSQRFNVENLVMDDAKKQQMAESTQNQQDPRIAVAQINAQARSQDKQTEAQAANAALQMRQAFDAQQAELDRALKQWEKNVDAQLEAARLDGDKNMNSDELKVALARETMKLRTQMKLAAGGTAPQVATPAMEPYGHAPDGMAFER